MSAPYPAELYPGCPCYACDSVDWPNFPGTEMKWAQRLSLCPRCGWKRCPGAMDHRNACVDRSALWATPSGDGEQK